MNDDPISASNPPLDPRPAGGWAASACLRGWLPWFLAAAFALFAGFMLQAHLSLQSEIVVLREQRALDSIEVKTLRQQIEAEHILSARRLADARGADQEARDLARLQVVPLLPPADVASGFLAVAVWNPVSQEGELVVAALPAPPPDKSYQLWLFDPEHPAGTSAAVFAVDPASNQARVPFKLDRSGLTGASLKISLERKGGAAAPEGPVVLAGR